MTPPIRLGLRVVLRTAERLAASPALEPFARLDRYVLMAARRKDPFDWAKVLIRDVLKNPRAPLPTRIAAIETLWPHRKEADWIAQALEWVATEGPDSAVRQATRLALGKITANRYQTLGPAVHDHIHAILTRLGRPNRFSARERLKAVRAAETWLAHEPVRNAVRTAAMTDPHLEVKAFAGQALARYQGPEVALGVQPSSTDELTARLGQLFDRPLTVLSRTNQQTAAGQVTRFELEGGETAFGRVISGTFDSEYLRKHLAADLQALAAASNGSRGRHYLLLALTASEETVKATQNFLRNFYAAQLAPARLVLLARLRGVEGRWMRVVLTPEQGAVLTPLRAHQLRAYPVTVSMPTAPRPVMDAVHSVTHHAPPEPFHPGRHRGRWT